MKNPTLILLIPFFVLFTLTSAFAQDDPAFETREKVREIRETVDQKRTEVKERVENTRQDVNERMATRLNEHADRLTNRFSIYIKRLDTLTNKLKIRLQAMQDGGTNVDEALDKVAEAERSLEMGQNYADEAIAIFSSMTAENYSRDEALRAKELMHSAREELRKTLQLLKDAVQLAKEAQGGAE